MSVSGPVLWPLINRMEPLDALWKGQIVTTAVLRLRSHVTLSQRWGGPWTWSAGSCTTFWIENGQEDTTAGEQVDYVVFGRCHVVGNEDPDKVMPQSWVLLWPRAQDCTCSLHCKPVNYTVWQHAGDSEDMDPKKEVQNEEAEPKGCVTVTREQMQVSEPLLQGAMEVSLGCFWGCWHHCSHHFRHPSQGLLKATFHGSKIILASVQHSRTLVLLSQSPLQVFPLVQFRIKIPSFM